ncbi:cobalt-precorrin-6A reductase [Spirulina subsalsa FACHB-351]|uniref:Cobalt-precorrin-6A reductase n=1 Tax=Spirulina subsalsa FACHB-351 TaxID=234711 RepID=A0ABT3LAY9_9CYAN|nr:cobalt-precorrin-6A reductase [Spirulina subsalsa]MCW6038657.1 cobalt-precorrin-6A reductase [Spirulina subsalsa FACHB-351]
MNPKRVLILGGTGEAAALAGRIEAIPGVETIASLAGRTKEPRTMTTPSRRGGFGGATGLADYLRQERIDVLIDATHPFAAQISFNAAQAASDCGIPRLMLSRPAWEKVAGDCWIEVESHQRAAHLLPGLAKRIFLTIGRQELATYAHLKDIWFLMRMIDPPPPEVKIPPGQLLLERGPFSLESERSLLQDYQIGALVSKNSGGEATYAKIIAARELGITVIMIQRPPVPEGDTVADIKSVLAWLEKRL